MYEDLRGNTDQNRTYEKLQGPINTNTTGEYKNYFEPQKKHHTSSSFGRKVF